jgi:hypothetical protein
MVLAGLVAVLPLPLRSAHFSGRWAGCNSLSRR